MRDKEKQAKENLEKILNVWKATREEKRVRVDDDDILQIVAKWTGIPLKRMERGEAQKLLEMESELSAIVVGQVYFH